MRTQTFTLRTDDGLELFVTKWSPKSGKVKAVVQLAHGMAEHVGRYAEFANALTDAGYIVYANDHRGHGQTAGCHDEIGYFADYKGWQAVVDDMHLLTKKIKEENPKSPVILMGHSMGSFLSRSYITQYSSEIDAIILSGTGGNPGVLGTVGKLISGIECAIRGRKARSPLMDKLSFGGFNGKFKNTKTPFDWLSRDPEQVQKYIDDDYCGGVFTAGFFNDMITAIGYMYRKENMKKIPKDLPILIFSGSCDPVGGFGKGVTSVYNDYKKLGVKDVTLKLYDGGRHEMLNETNRKDVYKDIINWLSKNFK